MKRIDAYIPDDLEQSFREAVARRLGFRKGNLSEALVQAIRLWIEKGETIPKDEAIKQKVIARVK
jgi:hypothetical protein